MSSPPPLPPQSPYPPPPPQRPVPPPPARAAGGRPAWLLPVLAGCGCLLVAIVAGVVALGWLGFVMTKESEKLGVRVEVPADARAGQPVDLVVVLTNRTGGETIRVDSIDIEDTILAGFVSRGSTPPASASQEIFGYLSQDYRLDVPPGQEVRVTMHLQSTRAGVFSGDVDVNGPMYVATHYTQVSVGP